MEFVTTDEATHNEIDPKLIGQLRLEGLSVPYVDLDNAPFIHSRLRVGDTEYAYERSFPVKGHSAVLPPAIEELQAKGAAFLVAERDDRYYLYLA